MATSLAGPANSASPARLAERLAGWLPILILTYPLIIWPLVFGVAESARGLTDLPDQVQESNPFNRIFFPLVFLVALGTALLVPLRRLHPLRAPALLLLLVYLAWAAASVAWALAPEIALRRLIALVCLTGALTLSVLAARDSEVLIGRIFGLVALAAFLNALVVAFSPPGPLGHEGIYTQKNTLGGAATLMTYFALYAVWTGRRGVRVIGIVVFLVAFNLLVASQSKTAFAVAILAPLVACGLLCFMRALRISAALTTVIVVISLAVTYQLGSVAFLWDFEAVAATLFGDPTLTGRTDIWAFVMEMISRRPLLGFGHESFWGIGYEGPVQREARGWILQMPHAHNGYMDIVLQTGAIGLGILLALLVVALHAASRLSLPPAVSWIALCIIIDAIAHNLLESSWFSSLSFSWIVFVTMLAVVARMNYENRARR